MMIIILYFTNSINILKQKPPCKACSHISVACDVSVNCLVMMGPYEYYIPLVNLCDSSRGHRSIPICSIGIAYNTVKDISICD